MTPRERLAIEHLRRDLARFSALVIAPGFRPSPSWRRKLKDYYTVDSRRLGDGANCCVRAAAWATSLGFFPVIVLGAAPAEPAMAELIVSGRGARDPPAVWLCEDENDFDRMVTSRHVVACGGIDVGARIRRFYQSRRPAAWR